MNIFYKKQVEYFNLGDNLYIDCINKYRNLLEYKSDMDMQAFSNDMRFICSQMGLACEYYLKGLIFPYLRINIPEDKEEYRSLIESLSEEEIYKILIGDDDILRSLSHDNSIRLRDLKFLQQYSIKNSGHNLLVLIDKFSDEEYADIPTDLKNQLFEAIKSYYFNYFGFNESYTEVVATNADIIDEINVSNISDSFVRGRYGHLDGFNLDYLKMIKLMHAIRSCCEKSSNAFSIVNGFGPYGTESASDITMIFPDENSKIYIIDDNSNVVRVYKYMNYNVFLDELNDIAFEKAAKETNYFNYISKDEDRKMQSYDTSSGENVKSAYDDLTLVPVYGINEMKRVTMGHDVFPKEYYSATMLLPLHRQIYIDKDKKQTICVTNAKSLISFTQYSDNRIRMDSSIITDQKAKIIEEFDKHEHSKDEIIEEFEKFEEMKLLQEKSILCALAHKIQHTNVMLEFEKRFKNPIYVDYLRKTKQLKSERRKALKEYKRIAKSLKVGRER